MKHANTGVSAGGDYATPAHPIIRRLSYNFPEISRIPPVPSPPFTRALGFSNHSPPTASVEDVFAKQEFRARSGFLDAPHFRLWWKWMDSIWTRQVLLKQSQRRRQSWNLPGVICRLSYFASVGISPHCSSSS